MIDYVIAFLITFTLSLLNSQAEAQSYTTTSKNCGKCGKKVSEFAEVGDKCPYCGVVWGKENTQTSTTKFHTQKSYTIPTLVYPSSNTSNSLTKRKEEESSNSNATKSETENWILEKLNKYTPSRYYFPPLFTSKKFFGGTEGSYYKNFRFSFDRYNITVTYEVEYSNETLKSKQTIPIYDINRIYAIDDKIVFSSKNETMFHANLSKNKREVDDYFSFVYENNAEVDLCERLHKAFIHLKKFYKKPMSSEPF